MNNTSNAQVCMTLDLQRDSNNTLSFAYSAAHPPTSTEGSGEHASYQSLLEFVQHVARQMEGSPEDDEVLLVRAQEKGDEIARTALCFRREKRALLLAAQEELRRALACQ